MFVCVGVCSEYKPDDGATFYCHHDQWPCLVSPCVCVCVSVCVCPVPAPTLAPTELPTTEPPPTIPPAKEGEQEAHQNAHTRNILPVLYSSAHVAFHGNCGDFTQ